MQIIVLSLIYLAGTVLSFLMARTEIAAEKELYTFGNRLITISFSLLSFVSVIIILISAWIKLIRLTGYWDEPVKKPDEIIDLKKPAKNKVLN